MYTLEEFDSELIFNCKDYYLYNNQKISTNTLKLRFLKKNPYCICCGVKGTIAKIKRHTKDGSLFFEIYHKRHDGSLILMTRDHIVPKHIGGKNWIENLQTMCSWCNGAKGNYVLSPDIFLKVKEHMPYFNTLCRNSARQRLYNLIKTEIKSLETLTISGT